VRHELVVVDDADAVAREGAARVAACVADTVALKGRCAMAVSGGATPWAMFARLAADPLEWDLVTLFQVDERVAPDGDPDRNLTHLDAALAGRPVRVEAMGVTDVDLDGAADAYAARLPARFDLVHLGLGTDGHTASLVPDDPVLQVTDRLVGVTAPYQDHRRMTLTYPALARADRLLWLVAGADKREALTRLLDGDQAIPAGRVTAPSSVVVCDAAAR
jgi:6-phosphogluconolactonase